MIGKKRKKILINGRWISYIECGSGKPLILIHGFFTSADFFRCIIPLLARHFRIIAPDLPGFGNSQELANKHNFCSYVDFLKSFLESLQIKKASFLGSSLGGTIILHFANQYPKYCQKLVLQAPVLENTPGIMKKIHLFNKIPTTFLKKIAITFYFNYWFIKMISHPNNRPIPNNLKFHLWKTARKISFKVARDFAEILPQLNVFIPSVRIRHETLLLLGENDNIHQRAQYKKFVKYHLQKGSYKVIKKGTHSILVSHPKTSAELVINFILNK